MSHTAASITVTPLSAAEATFPFTKYLEKSPTREMIVLSIVMALLQVLDGALTACGIFHFGTSAEGNMIIRNLMESIGVVPALIVVKSIALAVIASLCILSSQVTWIAKALRCIALVYVCAAIVPWSMILLTHLL